jgi:hypothetical protein
MVTLHGPIYIYGHISLSSSANENVAGKSCRKKQNTHFLFNTFFPPKNTIYEKMW